MTKLWKESTSPDSAGVAVRFRVKDVEAGINRQVASRGARTVNVLRNAELEVLKGQRSGKMYRKPHNKAMYRASAPGEAPARRTGVLRLGWNGRVKRNAAFGRSTSIIAELESTAPYAGYLDNGTSKMAPRPFTDRIIEKAKPEIEKIYREPYA
ncbi:MAG: hypothetical protein NC293_07640 [Roseburia sp.]|nr:hypothetical protein [Roseburia sp.]